MCVWVSVFYVCPCRKCHQHDSPFLHPIAGGLWRSYSRSPQSPHFCKGSEISGWTRCHHKPPVSWNCIPLMWDTTTCNNGYQLKQWDWLKCHYADLTIDSTYAACAIWYFQIFNRICKGSEHILYTWIWEKKKKKKIVNMSPGFKCELVLVAHVWSN